MQVSDECGAEWSIPLLDEMITAIENGDAYVAASDWIEYLR